MPIGGPLPGPLLALTAAATVFGVMFTLGLGIALRDFRWAEHHPGTVARGLFCALVVPPAIALAVSRALDLPRAAEIGIVLMSIAPGAPVALRRSLGAGGHRAFAPTLQIMLALLAILSLPLSVRALDEVYAGHAAVAFGHVAKQVFVAQLMPLALGMLTRRFAPVLAARIEPHAARLSALLLVALVIGVLLDIWQVVFEAGARVALAVAIVTALILWTGHLLGGPDASTRTAVALSSALRNPGLALLVATLNAATPPLIATVLAYLVVSSAVVTVYVLASRSSRAHSPLH